jgi:hypothetical protein|nr:hypothetical protein [uncultured Lachnoclostridium sp.]
MQTLTLQEIFNIVAKEKARRQIAKEPELQYKVNLESLITNRTQENLKLLITNYNFDKGDIWNADNYKPFKKMEEKVEFEDRVVLLIDFEKEGHTRFTIHNEYSQSNEEYLLGLTQEERENIYVVESGTIQGYRVVEDKVIKGSVIFEGGEREDLKVRLTELQMKIEVVLQEIEKLKCGY